ncbi:hypothetical protein ACFQ0G_46275 [Streptomyces chiangmaiensis]
MGTTTRRTATAAAAGALLLEAGYAHVLPSISQPTSDAVEHSSRNPRRARPTPRPPGRYDSGPDRRRLAWLAGADNLADLFWGLGMLSAVVPAVGWVLAALLHGQAGVLLLGAHPVNGDG